MNKKEIVKALLIGKPAYEPVCHSLFTPSKNIGIHKISISPTKKTVAFLCFINLAISTTHSKTASSSPININHLFMSLVVSFSLKATSIMLR